MAFDMVKYERGQVWVIRWKDHTQVGSEIMKDRPWLILSVGVYNQSSGMVTAVPLTTRDTVRTPAQVLMYNDVRRAHSIIACEQIRSFDTRSGEYLFDYLGNVSNEILEKVDVALSVHLGLHYSPITLNKLYSSMQSIITSVGYMQEKAQTPKFTEEDVLDFATKLQELAGTPLNEVVPTKETVESPVESTEEDISTVQEDPVESVTETTVSKKSARIRWTPEVCREFLNDTDTLPMKKVMEKWNIEKKTRVYAKRNYARTILSTTED